MNHWIVLPALKPALSFPFPQLLEIWSELKQRGFVFFSSHDREAHSHTMQIAAQCTRSTVFYWNESHLLPTETQKQVPHKVTTLLRKKAHLFSLQGCEILWNWINAYLHYCLWCSGVWSHLAKGLLPSCVHLLLPGDCVVDAKQRRWLWGPSYQALDVWAAGMMELRQSELWLPYVVAVAYEAINTLRPHRG